MTKVANVILYMLHKQVKQLNDKKVSIMLFLMDYNHQKYCGQKLFNETYIKGSRHPEPIVLSELFDKIIIKIKEVKNEKRKKENKLS